MTKNRARIRAGMLPTQGSEVVSFTLSLLRECFVEAATGVRRLEARPEGGGVVKLIGLVGAAKKTFLSDGGEDRGPGYGLSRMVYLASGSWYIRLIVRLFGSVILVHGERHDEEPSGDQSGSASDAIDPSWCLPRCATAAWSQWG